MMGRGSSQSGHVMLTKRQSEILLTLILWVVGLFGFGYSLLKIEQHLAPRDLLPVWTAARAVLTHHPPYEVRLFVYPPSLLLLAIPLGLVTFAKAKLLFLMLDAAAILLAGVLCLRLCNLDWRSRAGAAMLVGLAVYLPVRDTLTVDNVSGLIVAGEAGMLLAAVHRRWALAGILLGCTLAIKPVLLPLVLLPFLYRQWAATAWALALPVAFSLLALPLIVDGGQFLSRIVPFLLRGNAAEYRMYNVSLAGSIAMLGLPAIVALALRSLVLAGAALLFWLCWTTRRDGPLRLVELASLIMLTTFLLFSFSWSYYAIYLLPLLVPLLLYNWPPPKFAWVIWLGIYCVGGPDVWFWARHGAHGLAVAMLRVTLGFLLLLVAIGLDVRHRRRAISWDRGPEPARPYRSHQP